MGTDSSQTQGDDSAGSAVDIVGKGRDDDWSLALEKHVGLFDSKAPKLARLLKRTELTALAEKYTDADQGAAATQKAYKTATMRGAALILAAATLDAGVLALDAIAATYKPASAALPWVGAAGALCAVAAVIFVSYASRAALLQKWMSRRAAAETARLAYFAQATSEELARAVDGQDLTGLARLQLEYFRRYQLELQLAYYKGRGKQHERASNNMVLLGVAALAVAGLASLTPFIDAKWVPLAALGAAGAALGAFASNVEGMRQDRRNAERYEGTHGALLELAARLDLVRTAVNERGHNPLSAFVEAVHDQLSLEHRQWLALREGMSAALKRLEDELQQRGAVPHDGSASSPDSAAKLKTESKTTG